MEDTNEMPAPSVSESATTNRDVEKQEEEKLKSKYPAGVGMKGPGGHSAFLQKRLQKGVSFLKSFYCTESSEWVHGHRFPKSFIFVLIISRKIADCIFIKFTHQ